MLLQIELTDLSKQPQIKGTGEADNNPLQRVAAANMMSAHRTLRVFPTQHFSYWPQQEIH